MFPTGWPFPRFASVVKLIEWLSIGGEPSRETNLCPRDGGEMSRVWTASRIAWAKPAFARGIVFQRRQGNQYRFSVAQKRQHRDLNGYGMDQIFRVFDVDLAGGSARSAGSFCPFSFFFFFFFPPSSFPGWQKPCASLRAETTLCAFFVDQFDPLSSAVDDRVTMALR